MIRVKKRDRMRPEKKKEGKTVIAIDLYRKYLYNSTKSVGRTEKQKKLSFEEEMIGGILSGVDDLFYQDKSSYLIRSSSKSS